MSKLVRDKIPDLFPMSSYRTLTATEYAEALRNKLTEEVREYRTDGTPEELADVLEVLHALAALHGLTPDELEAVRARKAEERGGFGGRVWLDGVLEEAGKTNAR